MLVPVEPLPSRPALTTAGDCAADGCSYSAAPIAEVQAVSGGVMLFSSSLPLLVTPGVGLAGGSWLHEWDRFNRLHGCVPYRHWVPYRQVCTGTSAGFSWLANPKP